MSVSPVPESGISRIISAFQVPESGLVMASKYVNMEAAASQLNISTGELNRLREAGKIRAFADRGTWKFKIDDVEALGREIQPDSGHDIPMHDDDVIELDDDQDIAGGSKIVLEEEMSDQPTVISKQSPNQPPSSDSDVRLVVDPSLESDSWSQPADKTEGTQPPKTSPDVVRDSDVRFVDANLSGVNPTPLRADETEDDSKISLQESDDRWAGISDSDVRLAPLDMDESNVTIEGESGIGGSGDDIPLAPADEQESDVTLVGEEDNPNSGLDIGSEAPGDPGSDITLMPMDDESEPRLADDDDDDSVLSDAISGPASGLSFSSGDSGISLDLAIDSGISLDEGDDDDSITLGADSGISLVPDSGIGLTLDDSAGMHTLSDDDDDVGGATVPMLGSVGDDDEDTSFDMPLLEDSGDEIEADDDNTAVVMFDDDESADTMEFDSGEVGEDEFVDFDDEDSFDELSNSDLNVGDDLLDDDDDVLEADDTSFEDDFESGESVSSLPVPGGMRGGAAVAPVAAEWDMLSFSLVLLSTLFMGVCTLLMYDLVRSMWSHETPIGVNGMILDALQGFIKS